MEFPKELDFERAASSPIIASGTSTLENMIAPVGTNSFSLATIGSVCSFDLPNRGFIDGSTLYLRYKYTVKNTIASQIKSTAGYAPINRVDTFVGSQCIESLINYNTYMNMKVNTTMNNSMKYSQAASLGIRARGDVVTSNTLDGRFVEQALGEFAVAVPLDNCLSNLKDVFVPALFMGSLRVTVTFDSLANIFAVAAAVAGDAATGALAVEATGLPTSCDISDVFLCYTSIHFPPSVDDVLRKQYANDNIILKSQSYLIGSNTIAKGAIGQLDLQYNHRLSSVRSCFLLMASPTSVNSIFDSFDITQNNGEYSIMIAGKMYPSRPYNTTAAHKPSILVELRKAVSTLYNKDVNMSINITEFNRILTATPATSSSVFDPAKFFVGFRTHVLSDQSSFLSGVSTQDSPIAVRIVNQVATGDIAIVSLVSVFDLIIKVDVNTKTATTAM